MWDLQLDKMLSKTFGFNLHLNFDILVLTYFQRKIRLVKNISIIYLKQYQVSFQIRDHSKMTSPQKCKNFRPSSPYVTVSHFFHYTLPLQVTRQTVTNFSLIKDYKKKFYMSWCNWYELNRSTDEPATCLTIYKTHS